MPRFQMTATSQSGLEECERLHARLSTAEKKVHAAIGELPEDHPLVLASLDLLAVHDEVRAFIRAAYDSGMSSGKGSAPAGEAAKAAIDIERDAHTLKPEFKDVVKALFMWKDAPEERVKDGGN